jgi:hypothetical protein
LLLPPLLLLLLLLQVTGSWMTKLEALLRRLLLLRSAEPGVKALVFSQFPDALALASKAMDVAQVQLMFCCFSRCRISLLLQLMLLLSPAAPWA